MFKVYQPKSKGTAFEQETVVGVFTQHADTLEGLLRSREAFLPNVLFCMQAGPDGFNLLRARFLNLGKRYWAFVDDSIRFLNPTIIHEAVASVVRNKWGAASVYLSHSRNWLRRPYDASPLKEQTVPWLAGYFMLIDSAVVGEIIEPPGQACSLLIQEAGYEVGLSPNFVYQRRQLSPPNRAQQEKRFGSWAGSRLAEPLPCSYPDADLSDVGKIGWSASEDERRLLFDLFLGLDVVVDVGTALGAAARLFAAAGCRKVYTVADLDRSPMSDTQEIVVRTNLKEEIQNGQAVFLRMSSQAAAQVLLARGEKPEAIYFDGSARLRDEIAAWLPVLRERAVLCGRGWNEPGVQQAVRELLGEPLVNGDVWQVWRLE